MLQVRESARSRLEPRAASHAFAHLQVRALPGPVGAEVVCGDVTKMSAAAAAELRAAWLDHLVLLVRGQHLADAQLLAFARHFGDLEPAPVTSVVVHEARPDPYVCIVSNVVENGVPIGSLGNDEAVWHTDMSHLSIPPAASILHGLEVPGAGGETGFVNMYLALETLPLGLRSRIEGLTLRHDGSYNSAGVKRRVESFMDHPLICTHPETGFDVLYLGRRPHARINGLPQDESDALLDALWAHATRSHLAWHHTWQVGDVLIWDNRCCMHHRNAFDAGARRVMHRAQTQGSRPTLMRSDAGGKRHPRATTYS